MRETTASSLKGTQSAGASPPQAGPPSSKRVKMNNFLFGNIFFEIRN